MLTDPRVFDEGHQPRSLPHRDGAIDQLSRALRPTTFGQPASDVLVEGPSGVGKTVTVQHTLDQLRERGVRSAYVRSLGMTTGSVLLSLLDQFPVDDDDIHQTTPVDERRRRLTEGLDRPVVAVLDEADDLPETDIPEELGPLDTISTIVITHDATDWLARVDERARSTYRSGETIPLERYRTTELADILEWRVERGLRPGVITREQLERLADRVAGVAREGIQTLRAAAELARERGHREIHDGDLVDGRERARHEIRQSSLQSLPWHHHVLYALIHNADGPLRATTLHEEYDAAADRLYEGVPVQPVQRRTRRNKLQKLQEYDLLDRAGEGGAARYTVVDDDVYSRAAERLDGSVIDGQVEGRN